MNKIEPKFHKGDWVVDKYGHLTKIMRVDNNFNHITYDCRPIEENSRDWVSYSENDIRLWTIQDANDGDVLTSLTVRGQEGENQVFIFKCINNRTYVKNCIEYYCRVYNGEFYVNKIGYMGTTSEPLCPATKEQRDLLFQKMKGAGYEWNAENKELKKIEPKFKVGDWVTDGLLYPMQISSIDNGMYYTHNDTVGSDIETMDKEYHLWTIEDAKDGDVLVASDNSIFIFSHCIDNACVHHIALEVEDNIVNINNKLERVWEAIRYVHPATKEQRDLLFQKLKEAGYEWNAENKELKKIE